MIFNKIFQWWVGYKLPLVHVNFKSGIKKIIADILYHPIKRRIAKYYIFLLKKLTNIKIIAITGSAGKTTTKEMLSSILCLDGKTVYSEENIDPVFNIPRTILRTNLKTKYLVLEFGVEYPNEMDFYLWLVKPDIGVITNIFPTHTLFFKNREGVLKEKSKLVKKTNITVINKNDNLLSKIKFRSNQKAYYFNNGDYLLDSNKNAAQKIAEILNIDNKLIKKGLLTYTPQKHRLSIIKHKQGAVIVDDSYNSNPEALISSIKYFKKLAGKNKKILVVGDMLELGKISIQEHKRLGRFIRTNGFEMVYGVGDLAKYITKNILTIDQIAIDIKKYLKTKHFILIKGSRSIGLDRLVDKLL